MELITEIYNWSKSRQHVTAGCPVSADMSATQLLYQRLSGKVGRGQKDSKEPEEQGTLRDKCLPSTTGNVHQYGCPNKTHMMVTPVNTTL